MADNIFVKIHKNLRQIKNLNRDMEIVTNRVIPSLKKILGFTSKEDIAKELRSIARMIKRMSWSNESIKTNPIVSWHLLEHLHIYDPTQIELFIDNLIKTDGINALESRLNECVLKARSQVVALEEQNKYLQIKAESYSEIETLTDHLESKIEDVEKSLKDLTEIPKYSKIEFKDIDKSISLIKDIVNSTEQDETKKETLKNQLKSLKESIEKLDSNDRLVKQFSKKIEVLSGKVDSKVKKDFDSHLKGLKIHLEISSIRDGLSNQPKHEDKIGQVQLQLTGLRRLQANFSELRKFIYLGQDCEIIDKLIINILDSINQDMSKFSFNDHALINKIISLLANTIEPENSKLLSNRSDLDPFILSLCVLKKSDNPIRELASIDAPLYVANKILNGESSSIHNSPVTRIKKQFKDLKESYSAEDKDKTAAILLFIQNVQLDIERLTFFKQYVAMFQSTDDNELIDQISMFIACISKIKSDPIPETKDLEELALNLNQIFSTSHHSVEEPKPLTSISYMHLKEYKGKLGSIIQSINDSSIQELIKNSSTLVQQYKKNINLLERMHTHYTQFNPEDIQDEEFEELYKVCRGQCDSLVHLILNISPPERPCNPQADRQIATIIQLVECNKIRNLKIEQNRITKDDIELTLFDLLLYVADPKNWDYKDISEWDANHTKFKNELRKAYISKTAPVGLEQLQQHTYATRKVELEEFQSELVLIKAQAGQIKKPISIISKKTTLVDLFDESLIMKEIQQAHDFLKKIVEARKNDLDPDDPYQALGEAYDLNLINYALYLTNKLLESGKTSSDSIPSQQVHRLALLRGISILGETFNRLQKTIGNEARLEYNPVNLIKFRNKLQHFSTTKHGPAELRSFLEQGCCSSASSAPVPPKKSDVAKNIYKIHSPLRSIERILEQFSYITEMRSIEKTGVDPVLWQWALEYMTTFIGGDLISRLESNQIFLDNFSQVYIDTNHIDPITSVNLGAVLVVLEQVRMYRNDLSHAHLSLMASPEETSLKIKLVETFFKKKKFRPTEFAPEDTLHQRFKPTMQLCWAILMLTDKDRQLKKHLKNFISDNLSKFEKYLDITEVKDTQERLQNIITKLNQLAKQYGRPHLKAPLKDTLSPGQSEPQVQQYTNVSYTKGEDERIEGLGLFKQYYRKVSNGYEEQSKPSILMSNLVYA